MKTVLRSVILFLTMYTLSAHAQSPYWAWAKSSMGTGTGVKMGKAVAVDNAGNVYVTGCFSTPTVAFGSITLTNMSEPGGTDIFLVKYDASGTVLWAKNMGAESSESGEAVTTDAFGNVYIAGYFFSHAITFGTTTLTNYGPLTGWLKSQEFLIKLDASGNVIWAKTTSGSYGSEAGSTCLATDAAGNIYEAGYFWSATMQIGPFTLINLGPADITNDIFVAKYSASGDVLWAKSAGGNLRDICKSISVDASGSVYMTGKFESSTLTLGTTVLTNMGNWDMFLARYETSSGNTLWAKNIGGTNTDIGAGVAGDGQGNVYVTGYFFSSDVATTTLTNTDTLTSRLLLAKYGPTGNIIWAESTPGHGTGGQSISIDTSGHLYLMGYYTDTIIMGTNTFVTSYNPNNIGNYHIVVARCDTNGSILWANGIGGTSNDMANNAVIDGMGNMYLTGYFSSPTIAFDPYTLSNTTTGLSGEMFLSKLRSNNITGAENIISAKDITLYPSPAQKQLYIDLHSMHDNVRVYIYDMTGKLSATGSATKADKMQVDISHLCDGMYILSIADEHSISSTPIKFLKQSTK